MNWDNRLSFYFLTIQALKVGVRYPVGSYQRLEKWYVLFPCLAFSTSGKSLGMKHTVLPDVQLPTVAFTVLAQLCGPQADKREMGVALFTKNGEEKNIDFEFDLILSVALKIFCHR